MATVNAEKFAQLLQKGQEELSLVVSTFKEKGMARFGRTIAVGAIMVFFSYYMVYLPPGNKIRGLQRKIDAAKAIATYADQYKDARDRLNAMYIHLPPGDKRERWLTEAVLDSMKAENIMSDSIVPPSEEEANGLVIQRLSVSIQLKFADLVSWLNRIEANKPLLQVVALDLTKKDDPLGVNLVTVQIGTVIPSKKAGQL